MTRYILALLCPDRPGIVNHVTGAMLDVDGNIVESAQFGDPESATFAMRTVFDSPVPPDRVETRMDQVVAQLDARLTIRPETERRRVLIMVSRYDHCLLDLLFRHRNGELAIDIPLIVSNHNDCRALADRYDVPFEHVPVSKETKRAAEATLVERVDQLDIDFIVLARYMQVLTPELCRRLEGRVINIHHSFLPGFKGAGPYHQAHARGVKLIGATAHYVTADLDEGPIIEQDVARVSHTDTVEDMIRIGRDVERAVLARAVRHHAEDRVVLFGSKTAVFA
ncbi:MAG: formyltetrahydrofolate deformylase [Acidimicrobiia bacterium]